MIGLDLFVELLEPFELRREAAFGGGVDDQDDFVLEVGKRVGLAFLCEGGGVSAWRGATSGRLDGKVKGKRKE